MFFVVVAPCGCHEGDQRPPLSFHLGRIAAPLAAAARMPVNIVANDTMAPETEVVGVIDGGAELQASLGQASTQPGERETREVALREKCVRDASARGTESGGSRGNSSNNDNDNNGRLSARKSTTRSAHGAGAEIDCRSPGLKPHLNRWTS